ncbi:uncharacterized protein LOC120256443 [Dioscorea cayenensis subsp. rotundata]|uniref:Uncharacterized protein LOC120256443 n=1 Tax=Dioscorea cayennensis subsp. rotundata TaxID=55577 RepID=A0AB40B0K6_DIOCR|nr:uncharacterized protein LOC120256443 [Dioscorea cayenensis subsp. rotundata]
MASLDRASDRATSKSGTSKRGTPNKRWKTEYDNYLIPLLVDQVSKGLKCDKSFKREALMHVCTYHVNVKFNTEYTPENVENHYRTLKARYAEIKKVKDLSGAGWDDTTKTMILEPVVAFTYIEDHPAARPYINKPIENYEALKIICGEDYATASYATSMFSEFGDRSENEDNNLDNGDTTPLEHPSDDDDDDHSAPQVVSSPATSSTPRSQRSNRSQKGPSMSDLLVVVGEMADAIKNPTHWTEYLYTKVMEVEGFDEAVLVDVFDYLQLREGQARGHGWYGDDEYKSCDYLHRGLVVYLLQVWWFIYFCWKFKNVNL